MTRAEMLAGLLDVRAEAQRSVSVCVTLADALATPEGRASNERMRLRFVAHIAAVTAAIEALRGPT